jgi:RNA polymerase sigma factor (sigma-70 family)
VPDDTNSFEIHWFRVRDKVAGYFFRKGCSVEDTQDLVQETAMGAWRNYSTLKGDFNAWIFGIAKNTFNSYVRNKKLENIVEDEAEILETDASPEHRAIAKILMKQCLTRLNPIDRKSLVLHDFYGKKYEEISAILGISRSNAHYHVEKARDYIRKRYPELVIRIKDEVCDYEESGYIQGLHILN